MAILSWKFPITISDQENLPAACNTGFKKAAAG